jgi:Mg-chelatase subunit ChlD
MAPIHLLRKAGLLLCAAAVVLFCTLPARAVSEKLPKKKPQVEVVFCLDTTSSMTHLIEGAKQKIWAISNQIASGRPTPHLKVGLVAFRDKGDDYITQVVELTDDLDAIYAKLKKFEAKGGGDIPESVNQALNESVTKIKWSTDKNTMRIIFLVGDAPPHMDYTDDVKYPETCKLAREKGIIINTVQCGDAADTKKYWEEICKLGGGNYVRIAQQGGVVVIKTPFDKKLAEINEEMARTTLVYGDPRLRAKGEAKKKDARALAPEAAAERAAFAGKSGRVATYDLLDSIKSGKVKLEKVKKENLPPEIRKMSLKEQKEYLKKLGKRRAQLSRKAMELDKKRAAYIKEKLAKDQKKAKDGFDQQVLKILQNQAKAHKIKFED